MASNGSATAPSELTANSSALFPRDRLIVALDLATAAEARNLVAALGNSVSTFKVGKQLFVAEGPGLVRELVSAGHNVFLDLKFHDIPNTVGAAVRSAAALGVSMLTVHASGGSKMLRAAVEAAQESPQPPMVLAVTVLTSMADDDLSEVGFDSGVLDQSLRLASLAETAGCGGVVTSAHEARALRRNLGPTLAIVTPGVRLAGGGSSVRRSVSREDQARVVTPSEAIAAGASHIVVGRPITEAPDPAAVARRVLDEIEGR
jgi:orotidine-5'-phosphate decarboxylase